MSSRLRSFGPVRVMAVGAYGEMSDDVHQLLDVVVTAEAERCWRQLGARTCAEARSYLMCRTVRSWGITAAREFARHRLRRVEFVAGLWERLVLRGRRRRRGRRAGLRGWARRRGWRRTGTPWSCTNAAAACARERWGQSGSVGSVRADLVSHTLC